MKKITNLIIIIVIMFLVGIPTCNAEELNCKYTLKQGSKGENVKQLQRVLNEKVNCNLSVDGSFGKLTKNCVKEYQRKNNLDVDGIVGKYTCNSLNGIKLEEESPVIKTYDEDGNTYAIVLGSKINIREKSSTSSSVVGQLLRGNIVKVEKEYKEWTYVTADNKKGFIRNDLISSNCIIVDISEQTFYYYENGNLKWSTSVVTGNEGNHDTPVGSYKLNKANYRTKTYLKGYNDNGTKYKSYVDYWMPFILSRGIGFHDASWRASWEYTQTRFKGHGSHGCVNMQHKAAEKLYNEELEEIDVVVRD